MSAFTATHSLTLSAAALGWVRVPQPPVEACNCAHAVASLWLVERMTAF